MIFKDRFDAGHQLADKLLKYKDNPDVIILAVPRGGLELGYVLSKELHAPLDVIFTKKIGYPGNPEYAIGAASLTTAIIDERFANAPPYFQEYIDHEIKNVRELLHKRYQEYKGSKKPLDLNDKIVIVTDDGVATGKTLEVTLELIKKNKPKKVIVAIPVGSQDAVRLLGKQADEVVCLLVPEIFFGVGQFYQNFDQVSDERAIALLHEAEKF